jgi:hypothetical protein
VVMLEGGELGEHCLTKLGRFWRRARSSTRNWRACMRNLMKAQEAKGVCKDRSKWEEVSLPQRETGVMLCMYV